MDASWWQAYIDEVKAVFKGRLFSSLPHCFGTDQFANDYRNSGAGAIALAAQAGSRKIILLGYDCQKTHGQAHHHGDHPKGLGNADSIDTWPAIFGRVAKDFKATRIVNCSSETALDVFDRGELEAELQELARKPALKVVGMHGMGDNLHQRAIVRELSKSREVWLETPWPCFYRDLDVHVVRPDTRLRTQAKNAARESDRYDRAPAPEGADVLRVNYPPESVRRCGSVLAAMSERCGVRVGDFRLPVPAEWLERADALIGSWRTNKPVLVYRPLVERTEWGGCAARNPDINAYRTILDAIREQFFVVSVADLKRGQEWMVSSPIGADVKFHAGELDIEILTGIFKRSALVYTAPGFAVVLAQAVGVPVVSVFGGYEDSSSFAAGARFSPYLGIDPIHPVRDFRHNNRVDKTLDVSAAIGRALEFIHENCAQASVSADYVGQV